MENAYNKQAAVIIANVRVDLQADIVNTLASVAVIPIVIVATVRLVDAKHRPAHVSAHPAGMVFDVCSVEWNC